MKKNIGIKLLVIVLFFLSPTSIKSQNTSNGGDRILLSTGVPSYLGLGWMKFGQYAGFGINFQSTYGTWLNMFQDEDYGMGDTRIYDDDYSWEYEEGEYHHDRGFITFRLYITLSQDDYGISNLFYLGVGPGWSRDLYGYNQSGSESLVYVEDRRTVVNATEWEIGYFYDMSGLSLTAGISAINFKHTPQLTLGIGFAVD